MAAYRPPIPPLGSLFSFFLSLPSLACGGAGFFFQEYRLQSKDLPAELVRATPNPRAFHPDMLRLCKCFGPAVAPATHAAEEPSVGKVSIPATFTLSEQGTPQGALPLLARAVA